jgi:hypothetical protein
MGIQDAPRKRRPPVCNPGAWAGSFFITTNSEMRQTVSQAKWDKARSHISELLLMLAESLDGLLDYKKTGGNQRLPGAYRHDLLSHHTIPKGAPSGVGFIPFR